MIKKTIFAFILLMLVAFSGDGPYKDGNYTGTSRAIYTNEPYYGYSKIAIKNGKIIKVEFFVRDSSRHEYFDDKYEKYFAGNNVYIQQCRNDWKGIQSYPDSLLKYQDLDKVDVISGATWSYNIFKASTQEALSAAENAK
jgi:major membrane immunogen (membrane-anchored lipoprotein)